MGIFKTNVKMMLESKNIKGLVKALGDREAGVRIDAAEALPKSEMPTQHGLKIPGHGQYVDAVIGGKRKTTIGLICHIFQPQEVAGYIAARRNNDHLNLLSDGFESIWPRNRNGQNNSLSGILAEIADSSDAEFLMSMLYKRKRQKESTFTCWPASFRIC